MSPRYHPGCAESATSMPATGGLPGKAHRLLLRGGFAAAACPAFQRAGPDSLDSAQPATFPFIALLGMPTVSLYPIHSDIAVLIVLLAL